LFLVGGIIAYYVVDKNQDDLRTNLKNLLIWSVISIVFSYLISLTFSILIYTKKQNELKNKDIYNLFFWGLIPIAQQYTWKSTIKLLKQINHENPRDLLTIF
jgi:ABC-type sugar transport system permease subunit